MVEEFANVLDRSHMRRVGPRARQNDHKRYLIQVPGFILGIPMRAWFGYGRPSEPESQENAVLFVIQADARLAITTLSRRLNKPKSDDMSRAVLFWSP